MFGILKEKKQYYLNIIKYSIYYLEKMVFIMFNTQIKIETYKCEKIYDLYKYITEFLKYNVYEIDNTLKIRNILNDDKISDDIKEILNDINKVGCTDLLLYKSKQDFKLVELKWFPDSISLSQLLFYNEFYNKYNIEVWFLICESEITSFIFELKLIEIKNYFIGDQVKI